MDYSHLIYQLIVGAAILGIALYFLRLIGMLLSVAMLGIFIYYISMASPQEKEELMSCAKGIPGAAMEGRFPTECNDFIYNVKNNVANRLEERAKIEATKIENVAKEEAAKAENNNK